LCCLGCVIGLLHERTMGSIGFLAQASMSRLGEINRGSPKLLHASSRSGDPRSFWASEHLAQARGVSPKRDPAWGYCSPFSSPRLGEGGSLEQESLAWARPFSLSKELGEGSVVFGCFLFLDGWHLLGYNCYGKNMWWTICMSDVIHGWWMMGLVWIWHVN